MASVAQTLGMSTIPAMCPSHGAVPIKLYRPWPRHADKEAQFDREPASIGQRAGWMLFFGIIGTMFLLLMTTVMLLKAGTGSLEDRAVLSRMVGGGIVSPAALTLCLIASLYASVITGVRRLSLIGRGYSELGRNSPTFALMRDATTTTEQREDEGSQLAALLDMPAQNLPVIYPLGLLLVLLFSFFAMWQVSTIDGWVSSWFVRIGSLTVLGAGLLLLSQGLATWNTARSHLRRLARSSIEPHFEKIAAHVPWEISLAPPRLTELLPVARLADSVMRDLRAMAMPNLYVQGASETRRDVDGFHQFQKSTARSIGVRDADMVNSMPLFAQPSHVEALR